MNIKDFKVGDIVYVLDYHYRNNESAATVEEAVVTNVTRKYVTVKYTKFSTEYKFHNELDRHYYLIEKDRTDNKLFSSMDSINSWKESKTLYSEIRSYFGTYYTNLTLDQLRRIKDIIDENDNQKEE